MERITIQNIRARITCEADAYVYVENLRWNGHPVCAHCGSDHVNLLNPMNGISRKTRTGSMSQRRVWKCYTCRKQFSVTTGTVFHGSKVSLEIWIFLFFEMCANKNGLAAREVERKYGLTAKTSWFVTQRIREAMRREPLSGMIANTTVEADETFIGGKPKNKHQQGRPVRLPSGAGARANNDAKAIVLSLVDRQSGEVYSQIVNDVTGPTIGKAIANIATTETVDLVTDGGMHYRPIAGQFASEFDFRYSTRKVSDTERTRRLLSQIGGKRLTYRPLRDGR
jgi:transposase-like protein